MGYQKALEIQEKINQVFVGKEQVVKNVTIALLAGGHILLEDVPGVGKTTLALALSKAIDSSFGRVQFTPDTLPGDIIGVSIYNMKTGEFEFREGVVMNQILLADEINRTSPKTQASLLEAMAENQITVDKTVYLLPAPFMVLATQNPIEFMGTYPLPEAQMDRFLMRLSIGYPSMEEELHMADNFLQGTQVKKLEAVCTAQEVEEMKQEVAQITVHKEILKYIAEIIAATRQEKRFVLGASPRAMLAMVRATQAAAYLAGRAYAIPDDVKEVVLAVLTHRLVLTQEARLKQEDAGAILWGLVLKAKVPNLPNK